MNKLNVLYTTDRTYVKYMLVSLYSLLENNEDLDITIHVVYDGFTIDDFKRIEFIVNNFKNANVYFYDFKKFSELIDEYKLPDWRGTKIANARVFFSSCIRNVDKLLYLDSDTIVVDSLKGLKSYDGTINMVQDSMPTSHWKNLGIQLDKYCNSGVLWIDINKWIEKECDKKISDILTSDVSYTFPDQDLLNMALRDDIKLLPPEYNLFSIDAYFNPIFLYRYYKQSDIERYSIEEMKKAKNSPIILHTTPFYHWRPWEENNVHPYNKIYEEYLYKVFNEINKEQCIKSPNPLLFKLYLYSKLCCPKKIKDVAKQLNKNFSKNSTF